MKLLNTKIWLLNQVVLNLSINKVPLKSNLMWMSKLLKFRRIVTLPWILNRRFLDLIQERIQKSIWQSNHPLRSNDFLVKEKAFKILNTHNLQKVGGENSLRLSSLYYTILPVILKSWIFKFIESLISLKYFWY